MRYRQEILFNLAHFGFGCHGNSLGSLDILDSIFEITDPENPAIHAKFVSISCTEMNLYRFECLAYQVEAIFSNFAKNSRNCSKFLIKPKKALEFTETRLMSY